MRGNFQLAVAQCVSIVGKVEENLAVAEDLCGMARSAGAELVLFPETHATGYSYRDLYSLILATAEPMSGEIVRRLSGMAVSNGLVVCSGMFERDGGLFYNTQVVAFPDGRVDRQRKGASACAESDLIALEKKRRVFEWEGMKFGILICADSSINDYREQFEKLDVSLLLHPCAGRITVSGLPGQLALQQESASSFDAGCRLAESLGVTCAVANPIGFSGEDYYPGNSWIVRPDGRYVRSPASAMPDEARPSLVTMDLQTKMCAGAR